MRFQPSPNSMYHSTGAGTIKERFSVVYLWNSLQISLISIVHMFANEIVFSKILSVEEGIK